MPLAWSIQDGTIMVHASGKVTLEEVRVVQEQILVHPGWRAGAAMFVDARAQTGAPTAEELRIIAREMTPLVERGLGPVAMVCGSSFIYGVARMFSVFAEVVHANVGAFREMDEAQKWLDAQPTATA